MLKGECIYDKLDFARWKYPCTEERLVSSIDNYLISANTRVKLDPYITPYIKINPQSETKAKWEAKFKLFGRRSWINLQDLIFGNSFLHIIQNKCSKIDKLSFIKFKFYASKDISKKVKLQLTRVTYQIAFYEDKSVNSILVQNLHEL